MNRYMTRAGLLARLAIAIAAVATAGVASADVLTIPGSGNPEYVLARIADAFNRSQTAHRAVVPPSTGTAGALRDLEEGRAVLGRVGRPLKDDERRKGFDWHSLGRDAVVFVGGAGVTVRSVTRDQAVAIFTGKVTDWSAVGGAPGPIRVIGREATDASRAAIGREIRAFESIAYGSGVKVVNLDPQAIELLDRYPTSLGFLNRSALFAAATRIQPLALDGIDAGAANLAAGRYPIWIEFGLVFRRDSLTPAAREFLAFVAGPEGTRILREHGVVAATPARSGG